jgi:hypothetical protein
MCARQAWNNGLAGEQKPHKDSLLRKWEVGSFKDIADAKEGHMTVNSLERIISEFPEALDAVKPLCLSLRTILFGDLRGWFLELRQGTQINFTDQS